MEINQQKHTIQISMKNQPQQRRPKKKKKKQNNDDQQHRNNTKSPQPVLSPDFYL